MNDFHFLILRPTDDRRLLHVADVIAQAATVQAAMDRAARHLQGLPAFCAPSLVFDTGQVPPQDVVIRCGDLLVCGPHSFQVVPSELASYHGVNLHLKA